MTMQKDMMGRAVRDSFAKLDPRVQIQNPVMFLVWLSAVMTSVLAVASIFGVQDAGVPTYYVVAIAVILWLTDLFSNFAEALAEGRGKAALHRRSRHRAHARRPGDRTRRRADSRRRRRHRGRCFR